MGRLLRPILRRVALALIIVGVGTVPSAYAQGFEPGEGFDWERVGDFPIGTKDLTLGPDSLGVPGRWLWASSHEGLLFLDATTNTWLLRGSGPYRLLPLSADTLILNLVVALYRSTDGGVTRKEVHPFGNTALLALAEVPPGAPHAGRVLVSTSVGGAMAEGQAYSDDRGATWAPTVYPPSHGAEDLAVVPSGPYAGYVVGGGVGGAIYSADGGQTFHESVAAGGPGYGDWVTVMEGPEGLPRVVLRGFGGTTSDEAIWVSDDGGQSWRQTAVVFEGQMSSAGLAWLGGGTAFEVARDGTVNRTDDGGETWAAVGRAPEVTDPGANPRVTAQSVVVGPDDRLYVGLGETGPGRPWVYRTEPLTPVATEPGPEGEEGLGLEVRPNPAQEAVSVSFVLGRPGPVSVVLYDGLGRRVAVVASGPYGAGRHTVEADVSALPAGVYVVRVDAPDRRAARRITLVR